MCPCATLSPRPGAGSSVEGARAAPASEQRPRSCTAAQPTRTSAAAVCLRHVVLKAAVRRREAAVHDGDGTTCGQAQRRVEHVAVVVARDKQRVLDGHAGERQVRAVEHAEVAAGLVRVQDAGTPPTAAASSTANTPHSAAGARARHGLPDPRTICADRAERARTEGSGLGVEKSMQPNRALNPLGPRVSEALAAMAALCRPPYGNYKPRARLGTNQQRLRREWNGNRRGAPPSARPCKCTPPYGTHAAVKNAC